MILFYDMFCKYSLSDIHLYKFICRYIHSGKGIVENSLRKGPVLEAEVRNSCSFNSIIAILPKNI